MQSEYHGDEVVRFLGTTGINEEETLTDFERVITDR